MSTGKPKLQKTTFRQRKKLKSRATLKAEGVQKMRRRHVRLRVIWTEGQTKGLPDPF